MCLHMYGTRFALCVCVLCVFVIVPSSTATRLFEISYYYYYYYFVLTSGVLHIFVVKHQLFICERDEKKIYVSWLVIFFLSLKAKKTIFFLIRVFFECPFSLSTSLFDFSLILPFLKRTLRPAYMCVCVCRRCLWYHHPHQPAQKKTYAPSIFLFIYPDAVTTPPLNSRFPPKHIILKSAFPTGSNAFLFLHASFLVSLPSFWRA